MRCGVVWGLFALLVGLGCSPGESGTPPDVEWRSYAGDPGSSKYSPLDQIDASNFADLTLAWSWLSAAERWKLALAKRMHAG